MGTPSDKVDAFVSRAKTWQGEIQKLRSILLECGLDEDLKWGKPCFQFEGANVAIIQPFKEHCSLMFFKGALLQDSHGLLRSQGENTQSALRLEFTSEAQIKKTVLKSYVKQAIEVEKSGLKVDFKAKRELELPEELTQILQKDRKLAKAFDALTPGRQRGYVMHFTSAKRSETRTARIEKWKPQILAGLGMNDDE
ncbi:MAG TPA: YdeI/OmpD-associated family protein [Polyangiaceae bacterium]|nr:YdeI/OmpD-associated family protein [Polyangiaceae bacterium]